MPSRHGSRRWWWASVAPALAGLTAAGASWFTSRQLLTPRPATEPAPSVRGRLHGWVWPTRQVRVAAVDEDAGLIQLVGDEAPLEGVWGLISDRGVVAIGADVTVTGGSAARSAALLTGSWPTPGSWVVLDAHVWADDPALAGLVHEPVDLQGPTGALPAWHLPPQCPPDLPLSGMVPLPPTAVGDGHWLVFVHGRGSVRGQGLRLARVAGALGYHTVITSYRNDPWAEDAATGRYALGLDEWADVEPAVAYALAHGAKRVILAGSSMGGAIVTTFLRNSALAERVDGVILDSPVLDWQAVLDHVLTGRHLPSVLSRTSLALVRYGSKLDWQALTRLASPAEFTRPVLLLQGDADRVVPAAGADRFAADRPDLVTYVRVPGARHVAAWNRDPARVEQAWARFLRSGR